MVICYCNKKKLDGRATGIKKTARTGALVFHDLVVKTNFFHFVPNMKLKDIKDKAHTKACGFFALNSLNMAEELIYCFCYMLVDAYLWVLLIQLLLIDFHNDVRQNFTEIGLKSFERR